MDSGRGGWGGGGLRRQVDFRVVPNLKAWNRAYSMENVLVELRREMTLVHNRKLAQPAEGTSFE
jgi:ubiquitin-conjugating enzyme E2 variant